MFVFLNIKNESAESGWLSAPILAGNLDSGKFGLAGIWKTSGLRPQHSMDYGRKISVDSFDWGLFRIDAAQDSEGFVEIVGGEGSNEVFIDHPFYFRIKCG